MENLPFYISVVFILTTVLTVLFFYKASNNARLVITLLVIWLVIQSLIALKIFYVITNTIPPRFSLLIMPPLILIVVLFFSAKGKHYMDNFDIKTLTLLHIIRLPVELVLFWLFLHKEVPKIMTFEGRNFDFLSGLTAPFIYYLGFIKKQLNKKLLLGWNIACLLLLINVIVIAVFSAPFPFQKFGFEQPDIAILYFPFVWLPCCVVPIVLLSHLISIRQLLYKR
jgi:hypothetical protein